MMTYYAPPFQNRSDAGRILAESLKHYRGSDVLVFAMGARELIKTAADEVICPVVSYHYPFAVAGFYRHWHDLTDEEVLGDLEGFAKGSRGREND